MNDGLSRLAIWMAGKEDEHLEFKEAKSSFEFEDLVKYCCALANEKGGWIVLGVTDVRPRQVVGTAAFEILERTKSGLIQRLHLRIEVEELAHPDGRVLAFHAPSRPVGMPIQYKGAYWMRAGEDLVPMTPDLLKRIFDEAQPDFSAQVCPGATLADLEPSAIEIFRNHWREESGREDLGTARSEQLLEDAELLVDSAVTYAALILMGSHRSLGKFLAQSEIIFEYRSDEASIAYQQRKEFREGFLLCQEELWKTIDLRNDRFSYQEGFFRKELPAFNELAVREAILNAVSHRDYRLSGSTFVKQWPAKIEVTNPGGFPPDVTPENILFRQSPRNRRVAEALAKCGLVERSGQGADRMFGAALREGKLPPDFSRSDPYHFSVVLNGKVQDELFLGFLERLSQETQAEIHVEDLLVFDAARRGIPVPLAVRGRVLPLVAMGALEKPGRGKLILSKRFYAYAGKRGEYTRRKGLDRETRKALLLQHIKSRGVSGAPFNELSQVLPQASRNDLKVLLRELKEENRVHSRGTTRAAKWYPNAESGAA